MALADALPEEKARDMKRADFIPVFVDVAKRHWNEMRPFERAMRLAHAERRARVCWRRKRAELSPMTVEDLKAELAPDASAAVSAGKSDTGA